MQRKKAWFLPEMLNMFADLLIRTAGSGTDSRPTLYV